MPTKMFLALDAAKQTKIIEAGLSEFSVYGFSGSSTNRIVKRSGISKGSLFKYFTNKEEFFFYLLDLVTEELSKSLEETAKTLSQELFQRVIEYAAAEFSWYIHNPLKFKLILTAFSPNDPDVYSKVVARYGEKGQDIYDRLLEHINTERFQWDRNRTINVLKWFLKGFNEDYIKTLEMEPYDLEHIRKDYIQNLTEHMEVLKTGLQKKGDRYVSSCQK